MGWVGGGIGSRSSIPTDIGLNHQLGVFPDKNFRTSVVVGCLVGRCTKGKVPASGPGCIATPSTGNYPSTPLIAVLTICHCRGSLPLVPVYQRLLFNAALETPSLRLYHLRKTSPAWLRTPSTALPPVSASPSWSYADLNPCVVVSQMYRSPPPGCFFSQPSHTYKSLNSPDG